MDVHTSLQDAQVAGVTHGVKLMSEFMPSTDLATSGGALPTPPWIVKLSLKYYFYNFNHHYPHLETTPASSSFFCLPL